MGGGKKQRRVPLLWDDLVGCPRKDGVRAVEVLELFDYVTSEPFRGILWTVVGCRVRALAKVLGNVAREETWESPPTQSWSRAIPYLSPRPTPHPGGGGADWLFRRKGVFVNLKWAQRAEILISQYECTLFPE